MRRCHLLRSVCHLSLCTWDEHREVTGKQCLVPLPSAHRHICWELPSLPEEASKAPALGRTLCSVCTAALCQISRWQRSWGYFISDNAYNSPSWSVSSEAGPASRRRGLGSTPNSTLYCRRTCNSQSLSTAFKDVTHWPIVWTQKLRF